MTSVDAFRSSISDAAPPAGLDLSLQALWWVHGRAWDRAHDCVQQNEGDPACDWVHAHLHRIEGDLGNAAYWYRRAGQPVATNATDEEWAEIAGQLLARP